LKAPLNPKGSKKSVRSRASIFYGADEYLEELKKKYEENPEIAMMKNLGPDGGDPHAANTGEGEKGSVLSIKANDDNRSHMTGRLRPVSNKPDPMPPELAFLFAKITGEQMMYMWNVLTLIFFTECFMILMYAFALSFVGNFFYGGVSEMDNGVYWLITLTYAIPFAYVGVQHIYIDHDVMHGATWPPADWQKYITHPFSDFFSLPWEEFVLEHNRHHGSTFDLLIQGEFGWDPEMLQYKFANWTDNQLLICLTAPLCPFIHFIGINDTGGLFAIEWYFAFPDEAPGNKCSKSFYSKWLPNRMKHLSFVWTLWACVWFLGTIPMGRPLSEGWRFVIPVTCAGRAGFGTAWMFITNFTHSPQWNRFLANDPDRTWPCLHNFMAFVLGGRHRWNEMLFHDMHHAFPNAVGTLSQRGRFHGWRKVHDASVEVIAMGIWKANGDEETEMQKNQKKRSMLLKSKK